MELPRKPDSFLVLECSEVFNVQAGHSTNYTMPWGRFEEPKRAPRKVPFDNLDPIGYNYNFEIAARSSTDFR